MTETSPSRFRRAGALSGLVAASLVLAACSSNGNSDDKSSNEFDLNIEDCLDPERATQEITDTLTVGYSVPLSGPVAGAVELSTTGYDARIALANETGELGDLTIEVKYLDDTFQPDKAKANVTEFIEKDDVDVVSTFGTGAVGAMAEDQNAACVPMLYPSSSEETFADMEAYPWTVQFLPRATLETQFLLDYILAQVDDPIIGVAENATSSGKAQSEAFQAAAEAAGVEIVEIVEDTDPAAAATTLKAAGVTVVYHAAISGVCGPFDAAAERVGFQPELVLKASSCVNANEYIASGQAADGVVVAKYLKDPTDPAQADDPAVVAYMEELDGVATAGNTITVAGWVMADLLINTIKQAMESEDGLTQESIIRAARDQNYDSPLLSDGVTWTSSGTIPAGVSGFAPYAWSHAEQGFVLAGEVVDLK